MKRILTMIVFGLAAVAGVAHAEADRLGAVELQKGKSAMLSSPLLATGAYSMSDGQLLQVGHIGGFLHVRSGDGDWQAFRPAADGRWTSIDGQSILRFSLDDQGYVSNVVLSVPALKKQVASVSR